MKHLIHVANFSRRYKVKEIKYVHKISYSYYLMRYKKRVPSTIRLNIFYNYFLILFLVYQISRMNTIMRRRYWSQIKCQSYIVAPTRLMTNCNTIHKLFIILLIIFLFFFNCRMLIRRIRYMLRFYFFSQVYVHFYMNKYSTYSM